MVTWDSLGPCKCVQWHSVCELSATLYASKNHVFAIGNIVKVKFVSVL